MSQGEQFQGLEGLSFAGLFAKKKEGYLEAGNESKHLATQNDNS